MQRCAFLSTDNLEDFFVYDQMLIEPLLEHGWHCEEVSWRDKNIDWDQYEVVIIRSTWDYQQDCEAFLQSLSVIEQSKAQLVNSLDIVKWNISKKYLQELESKDVPIVPTVWPQSFDLSQIQSVYEHFDVDELVLKPLISAGSDYTYRLTQAELLQQQAELEEVFKDRGFMIQPFLKAILDEGEYSLFYFAGNFSHAIVKQPKQGDFRVQEEHGGQLTSITPNKAMLDAAEKSLQSIPEPVFYARIDLVKYQQEYVLMEVELVEPSLYFNMDPQSIQNFVEAFVGRFAK